MAANLTDEISQLIPDRSCQRLLLLLCPNQNLGDIRKTLISAVFLLGSGHEGAGQHLLIHFDDLGRQHRTDRARQVPLSGP